MGFPAYPVTDRQKQIVQMASDLAKKFGQRANENDWAAKFPYENYQDLKDSGYLTLTVPRDFGGWGANVLEVTLAQFYLAQGCGSTGLVMSMHHTNIAKLVEHLTEPRPLFAQICRAVVEEGAVINSSASEPATGSPSRGGRPETTARRQSDGSWVITGHKTFTTGAPILYYFIVSCSIVDEAGADANLPPLTLDRGSFLVPRASEGLSIEETWNSVGMRLSGSHDLLLENVHVSADALMDTSLPTNPAAKVRVGAWAFPMTAVYLGIAQAARDEAVTFARRRRPNSLDKPISSIPHIQEKVAKMDLDLLQAKAVLFGIADQFSRDPDSIPASQFAAAKYLVTNHAVEIVETAMRLVGGASLSLSFPLQRYYRDVRAGLHHPPMDDTTIGLLAREALDS